MRLLHFVLNGDPVEVGIRDEETLLEVLRARFGLTGTKEGCGQGACGACTVLLEGSPVFACSTLAAQAEGRSVLTIEGLGGGGSLHPLQAAFQELGAVQCGFCTPGMILCAKALLDRNPHPSEEEVRAALAGNICRCTGYSRIVEAVLSAAERISAAEASSAGASECDGGPERRLVGTHALIPAGGLAGAHGQVGSRQPRIDGIAKIRGSAVYTADLRLPGMLVGKILRSPHPHARIRGIDARAALELPGVRAVATGADAPVKYGVLPVSEDEYPLAVGKVRFVGDEVAAVAAVDEQTARAALELIRVDYEILPAILNPKEALVRDDVKVHEHTQEANIERRVELSFGEVEAALAASAHVREDSFRTAGASHAPLEPHCAVAQYEDGRLTLWTSTQVPHYVHRALAKVLQLPAERIRVVKPALGGGFGGKGEPLPLEFAASLLAIKTGRPVKIQHEREEVFLTHRGRHPYHMKLRTGVTADGALQAVDFDCLLDGGAYGSFGVVTLYYSGQLLTLPYHLPAYRFTAARVFTNKPPCGAQRGHGAVAPRFAFESHLDRIAADLGMDPVEIRRRNAVSPGHYTVNGLRVTSCGFEECLERTADRIGWRQRRGRLPRGRGVGLAGGAYVTGAALPIYFNDMPHSNATISVDRSGAVTVLCGAADIGQGSDTMLAQVAAEVLGLEAAQVRVVSADTATTPVDLGSYSSRVTFMAGNACLRAAQAVRERLILAVAEASDCAPEAVELRGGAFYALDRPEPLMGFAQAAARAETESGPVTGSGSYRPPDLAAKYRGGGVGPSPAYSFAAHAAEVEVDEETGEVKVLRLVAAHDLGRAINPMAAEGQIQGATVMGLGETLFERHRVDREGTLEASSFLDYKLPTALDVPSVEPILVESIDPEGPFGAKEVGEGSLHPSLPAVASAIFDAVGIHVDELPVTPEYIRRALKRLESAKE